MILNPLNVLLDNNNYRIRPYLLTEITNQKAIRDCLSENPLEFKLQDIIDSIISKKWMRLGARPVAIKQEDSYVVIEGNRRICACQMILNSTLRHNNLNFPNNISTEVLESIRSIDFDIADSRDELLPYLSERHIKSQISWGTMAKQFACIDLYEAGKTIVQICDQLNLKTDQAVDILRGYYLLEFCRNLEIWNDEERAILQSGDLKVDRLLRLFGTAGASKDFGLSFDEHFQPYSTKHNTEIFKNALSMLARKAFLDKNNPINTRTTWYDVCQRPDCEELRLLLHIEPPAVQPGTAIEKDDDSPTPPLNTEQQTEILEFSMYPRAPQLPCFFQALVCKLNRNEREYSGAIALSREIKMVSTTSKYGYHSLCTASALLLRSLLEQALKLHLKTHKEQVNASKTYWDHIIGPHSTKYDPTLKELVEFIQNKIKSGVQIFKDNNEAFNNALGDKSLNKSILDQLAHRTAVYQITYEGLDTMAKQGTLTLIDLIFSDLPAKIS